MKKLLAALALISLALTLPARSWNVPTPESALGFRPGEDRKLADWPEIVEYLQRLDAASDRVRVDVVGSTTEGNPFVLVTLTSAANMARLEELRGINARLADPRGLSDADAEGLIARGKTVVALNHGIHSTEVAGSLTAMETAYLLATTRDPDLLHVLDETIVLMIPSHNPDGTRKVADWYRRTLGTPYEGSDVPFLYQKYAGHDNNRDWYMFTQQETRLTVEALYERWHPQIVHDLHQMGRLGPRFFVPPYVDPWEPNVDPALRSAVSALGSHIAARLTAEGKRGVVVNALYDAWTPARAYPHTHGGVRILSEAASARLASPIDVPLEGLEAEVGYIPTRASWNHPAPWRGGTWSLKDVVAYQLSANRALLEHAAKHREFWLRNFLEVNRRACARTDPHAFVIPTGQRDAMAEQKLLWVLRTGGVEVFRARDAFEAGGRRFEAGAHVVPMQQPASAFAKMLLEVQTYPDLRLYEGGPPQRPYDVTAHTLPLLMGVEAVRVEQAPAAALEREPSSAMPPGRVEGSGRSLALGHATGDLVATGRLLEKGVGVRWALQPFSDRGTAFPAGTLLVPAEARERLEPLARELGLVARGVDATPPALQLRAPRVGLYQSWVASMDEGWTRYVFERELGLPYTTVHDAAIRAGGLNEGFDVIVLPDQTRSQIVNGQQPGTLPEQYTGGIGAAGVESLRAFVKAGGTLVALNGAAELPIVDFALPVKNVLASAASAGQDAFYCPGALLRAHVGADSPLGHGLPAASPVWFEESPAFALEGGTAVLRYADDNPLLSGWLLGGRRLQGLAALAEVPAGRGRVVLFGFRPQYRAQSWGTYVALLNALYTSAAQPDGVAAAAATAARAVDPVQALR